MPSVIVKTIFFDLDKLAWTLTAGGNALLQPLTIGQNDTIDFNVQFIKSGAAQTLTSPSFTAGIKVLNGFSDSFVVQFGAPTGTPPTYTFTATISSTELSAALLTGAQFAIEFRDSANGIVTLPALTLNIVASYTISGTTPTSANGTLVVAATKTVTFPQSLTFPSALGTNGFQLTTDGAGALTWAASGALTDGDKGDITVSNSGATFTIDNDVITLAKLAHMPTARVIGRTTAGNGSPELLTISGTGSVAMTNTPTLVTPVLGAATATSINGITITAGGAGTFTMAGGSISLSGTAPGSLTMSGNIGDAGGSITTNASGGSINTSDYGGSINTSGDSGLSGGSISTSCISGIFAGGSINTSSDQALGGSINTSEGGGSITTNGNGSIGLGIVANRTYLVSTAGNNEKTATFPNVTGTVAVGAHSATTTHAMFSAGAAGYTTRAIATADIATALTTPGAIGGTTASTGAFTTLAASTFLDIAATAATAGTATAGVIRQAGTRIFHSWGTNNLFCGAGAGNFAAALTGSANVGVGRLALSAITTGLRNVAFGDAPMYQLTTGSDNCSFGAFALQAMISGGENVGIGKSALTASTGSGLVAIGHQAGFYNTTGTYNSFVGWNSGTTGASGVTNLTYCTAIGATASVTTAGLSYCTAIGAGAVGTASNQVMLGRASDIVTLPGGLVTVPEALAPALNAGITVSVAISATGFALNGVNAATLANGTNGQIKTISCTAVTAAGTATLTPTTSAADYNTIAFTAAGQTATLQYFTTGGWYILSLRGAVAA
jgi:hypothetical protein